MADSYHDDSDIIKGAIWHALNHYQFEDALFLAERLFADSRTQEDVFLLATCHYRAGDKWVAKDVLERYGYESAKCKFLYTRVLIDMKEDEKAISELSGSCLTLSNNGEYSRPVSDFIYEFHDTTAFALVLAAELHQGKGQHERAADCYKKALSHNPFLFTPYQRLCQIGCGIEPDQVFTMAKYPSFELAKCVSPFKPADIYTQCSKVEIPVRKQSKQALQTVTNNTQLETPPPPQQLQQHVVTTTTPISRTTSSFVHTPINNLRSTLTTVDQTPDGVGGGVGVGAVDSPGFSPIELKAKKQTSQHKNQKRTGLRSTVRVGRSKHMAFDTNVTQAVKENTLVKAKRLTRSSTIDPKKDKKDKIDILEKPETGDGTPDLNRLKKKSLESDEAPQRKVLEQLLVLYRHMGASYWARTQHRFDEAKKSLAKLPHSHQETGWVLNQLARCLFDEQKYPQACDIYRKIQQLEPHRLAGMEYYSTCLFYKEDAKSLSALSSNFLQRARHRPETWCIAGNLFSVNQDHAAAKRYFCRAVEIAESNKATSSEVRHYAYTLLGHELILEEEFDKAMDAFRKAVKISPNIINAWIGIAQVAMKEHNFLKANHYYRKILQKVPKSQLVIANFGRSFYHIKKHDDALKCFKKALNMNAKCPISLFYTALIKYEVGNYEDCLHDLKKLDDMYPKDPQINYHLGQVYIKLGHANLGFTHMTRATKLDPKGTAQQKDSFAESSTLDSSTLENTNGGFDTTHEPSTYDIDLPGGESTMDLEESTSLQNLDSLLEESSSSLLH